MNIKDRIKELIIAALLELDLDLCDINIEIPGDKINGDYSSNVAMKLASKLKKSPMEIATLIVSKIEKKELVEKIEIARPGFLNFYINRKTFLSYIDKILEAGDNYGSSQKNGKKRINVEFASINPTGTIHLGHARGSAYGDNLCRILSFAGYEVTREYYINDGGKQIENMGKSIMERYFGICGLEEHMPEGGYFGKEVVDVAKSIYDEGKAEYVGKDLEFFTNIGLKTLLDTIKKDLEKFRVTFDIWASEKKIRETGKIEKSLQILKENKKTYEKEEALWLKSTEYGDEKDRVLIKKDGEYAYITPDIAYHLDKLDRGYDKIIDVLGADHHGYVPRLKAAIEALGYNSEKLEIKIVQMVKLLKDGEEVKMSKRTGNTITLNDLIEEVGIDAARYFFAMRNIESQMDFDIDAAIKKAHDNPVYYVSYAHARICSILKGKEINNTAEYTTINSEYAFDLLSKINEFPDVVIQSAEKRMPHLITNYVYELANVLHIYYNHEKILTSDEKYTNERLLLVKSVKIVIKNALNLIGVEAPNEM